MRCGQSRDQRSIEQLADALAGDRRVVADQRQAALLLPHHLVEQALRCSDTHEPADHDTRPGRDHCDGFFKRNGLHEGELRSARAGRSNKMLEGGCRAALIWVKAPHHSRTIPKLVSVSCQSLRSSVCRLSRTVLTVPRKGKRSGPFRKRICACNIRPLSNSMRRNAITKASFGFASSGSNA